MKLTSRLFRSDPEAAGEAVQGDSEDDAEAGILSFFSIHDK
jgi:hypothetical protein